MGSFLKAVLKGEEPDASTDPASVEEMYERMFPKIGRDFVHRDDLMDILSALLLLLGLSEEEIDLSIDSSARARAEEYRSLLSSGQDGSQIYPDLIDLGDV